MRYYDQAETASREAATLRAERDGESIVRVVRTAAESVVVRPEAIGDVITMLSPDPRPST